MYNNLLTYQCRKEHHETLVENENSKVTSLNRNN